MAAIDGVPCAVGEFVFVFEPVIAVGFPVASLCESVPACMCRTDTCCDVDMLVWSTEESVYLFEGLVPEIAVSCGVWCRC